MEALTEGLVWMTVSRRS